MSLIGGVARLLARRRFRRLRALARDPRAAQHAELMRIVARARDTAFGKAHDFAGIRTLADYQARVPIHDYAQAATWWDRARAGERDVCWPGLIRYWAITSGTTAGEKFMPVSAETIRGNKQGGFDSMVPFLAEDPRQVFGGKLVFLGGCTQLREHGEVFIGDNTGIMALHVPKLIGRWHVPSPETRALGNWERKIEVAAKETVDADVRMLSGVPSWIVLFGEHVLAEAQRRGRKVSTLREVWPNLALFVHGGVAFAPYRDRFLELVGDDRVRCVDTYSASEGGMLAVQDTVTDPGMLLLSDQGVFFECVPHDELGSENPRRVPLAEVETGVDYAVLLTTDSGIFSYQVGDLIRFTSKDPLRMVFAGRVTHTLNAFGEHISGGELDRAVVAASEATGAVVVEYASAAVFPDAEHADGGHIHRIEFAKRPDDLARFAEVLDATLQAGNEDYGTHRSYGLRAPVVEPLAEGTFYDWMRARGKFGGQNKVPRVLNPELERDLVAFLQGRT